MFLLGLLLLVTQSVTANSQTVELNANDLENKFKDAFPYRSGYAYGVGHCYGFTAPIGWKLPRFARHCYGIFATK